MGKRITFNNDELATLLVLLDKSIGSRTSIGSQTLESAGMIAVVSLREKLKAKLSSEQSLSNKGSE